MKALVFLTLRQLKNSLRGGSGRLRILLPGCFVLVMIALQVIPMMLLRSRGITTPSVTQFLPANPMGGDTGALVAAVRGILLLSVFTTILGSLGDGGLAFTASDIDFLFPSPIRKRVVLFFKMLAQYVGLLFSVIYFPFILSGSLLARYNLSPWTLWPGILATWLFFIAMTNIAQTVLLRRADRGDETEEGEKRRIRSRRILGAVVLVLFLGGLVAFVTTDIRKVLLNGTELLRIVNGPVASVALAPLAWASDLYLVAFEGWTGAAWGRLGGLLLFTGGTFALLFSRDRHFYENAVDFSSKVAQMRSAQQKGDAGAILSQMAQDGKLKAGRDVASFGGGARAVVWKDLISITRAPLQTWLVLLFMACLPAIMGIFMATPGRRPRSATTLGDVGVALWIVFFLLNTSSIFLLGLRDMLRRADITKALPIAPARLLLAELTMPITQLTVLGWISLGVMAATLRFMGGTISPLLGAVAIALPSLAFLLQFVQTCFVVLYPNKQDTTQNIVGGLVSVTVTTFAMFPSLALGTLLHLTRAPWWMTAGWVTAMNLAIGGFAVLLASALWQRFDPTD